MATVGNQDVEAYNAVTTRANGEAQNKYYEALSSGQSQQNALAQAQFAWKKTMDEAGLTGQYQGQWTQPALTNFANLFGSWGAPTAGQQTLAGQQQQWSQGQGFGELYGQYYAPGTAPTQGQQTLGAIGQGLQNAATVAGLTGYYNQPGGTGQGQQTLAGQQQQWQQGFSQAQFQAQQAQLAQQNAQSYLGILANLRGPADWAKYQQVLGSTPNGMRDLYAAAMGQYTPGGGATTGVAPQAADLNTLQQQVAGTPGQYPGYVGPQYQAQAYVPQVQQQPGMNSAFGGAAQPGQYSAQVVGGTATPEQQAARRAQLGGQQPQQTWGSGIGVGGQQASPQQQVQATGNGTNMYGAQQQQYNLPAPNQISSQAWNNFTPSQQQLMLGNYEAAGWDKGDVQALYNQSLPKYANNNASAGTWRLR